MKRKSAICAFLVAAAVAAPSAQAAYAPVNRAGPPLTVSPADLAASFECSPGIVNATKQPVLLLPATGVDSEANFSWNYERALADLDIPYCTSNQQGVRSTNMDDIQVRGDYVTYAIRRTHQLAGRPIAVAGHSQGGMVMRWALRFWPDTRPMVEDVIGFAGSNHGTDSAGALCGTIGCSAAGRQQAADSKFIEALNSRQETFAGIDYTEIYTHTDAVVTPNSDDTGSSSVHGPGGITNVAIQDICLTDVEEHLSVGTSDATAWALFHDAITHDGPADESRIPASVCLELLMPGVNPLTFAVDTAASAAVLANSFATYPSVDTEPPLRCYVFESCGTARASARCSNKMAGSRRADRLGGSELGDLIRGRRGRDRIRGGPGGDCLFGNKGRDRISGGSGDDRINGGKAKDRVRGGPGADVLQGRNADDVLKARDGSRDIVRCGSGDGDRAVVDRVDRVKGCETVRR